MWVKRARLQLSPLLRGPFSFCVPVFLLVQKGVRLRDLKVPSSSNTKFFIKMCAWHYEVVGRNYLPFWVEKPNNDLDTLGRRCKFLSTSFY